MDSDADHILSRAELDAEIAKTWTGYDPGNLGRIILADLASGQVRARSAMAGFVHDHAAEIDANSDGQITRAELAALMVGMFERADINRDGRLELAEFDARPASPPGQPRAPGPRAGGN